MIVTARAELYKCIVLGLCIAGLGGRALASDVQYQAVQSSEPYWKDDERVKQACERIALPQGKHLEMPEYPSALDAVFKRVDYPTYETYVGEALKSANPCDAERLLKYAGREFPRHNDLIRRASAMPDFSRNFEIMSQAIKVADGSVVQPMTSQRNAQIGALARLLEVYLDMMLAGYRATKTVVPDPEGLKALREGLEREVAARGRPANRDEALAMYLGVGEFLSASDEETVGPYMFSAEATAVVNGVLTTQPIR